MSLSILPAELILQILQLLDPESLFLCLRSCKLFRQHALASRTLLIDQLSRVPGLPYPIAEADAAELMTEFSRRAIRHLACGVSKMTDLHVWRAAGTVDRQRSKILIKEEDENSRMIAGRPSEPKSLWFAEVWKGTATINFYSLPTCNKPEEGKPRLEFAISPYNLPPHIFEPLGGYQGCKILAIAQDIAPIRPSCLDDDRIITDAPIFSVVYGGSEMLKKSPLELQEYLIIIFTPHETFGPVIIDHFSAQHDDREDLVAMAIARVPPSTYKPVVLYRRTDLEKFEYQSLSHTHSLRTYSNTRDAHTGSKSTTIHEQSWSPPERTGGFHVHKDDVYIYPWAFPLPQWATRVSYTTETPFRHMENRVPQLTYSFRNESLGRPFASSHTHIVPDSTPAEGDFPSCCHTILQLAISRPLDEDDYRFDRTGALLVKATKRTNICAPHDISGPHQLLNHILVAQLADIPALSNLPTHGLKLATSPKGTRIAIASWKTVKIWPLNPRAFLHPELGRDLEDVPAHDVYTNTAMWEYYRCYEWESSSVVLHPVELPSVEAVVYELQFVGEDELWGWTDKGLCRWRFGPWAEGRRVVEDLHM